MAADSAGTANLNGIIRHYPKRMWLTKSKTMMIRCPCNLVGTAGNVVYPLDAERTLLYIAMPTRTSVTTSLVHLLAKVVLVRAKSTPDRLRAVVLVKILDAHPLATGVLVHNTKILLALRLATVDAPNTMTLLDLLLAMVVAISLSVHIPAMGLDPSSNTKLAVHHHEMGLDPSSNTKLVVHRHEMGLDPNSNGKLVAHLLEMGLDPISNRKLVVHLPATQITGVQCVNHHHTATWMFDWPSCSCFL
mmetsp:Transcript_2665/g.5114  ORF Transcript_2665/g.5114 Transcript_2665/m.5114 type:complete len:247 (-) Transcript_2665:143-883(-)